MTRTLRCAEQLSAASPDAELTLLALSEALERTDMSGWPDDIRQLAWHARQLHDIYAFTTSEAWLVLEYQPEEPTRWKASGARIMHKGQLAWLFTLPSSGWPQSSDLYERSVHEANPQWIFLPLRELTLALLGRQGPELIHEELSARAEEIMCAELTLALKDMSRESSQPAAAQDTVAQDTVTAPSEREEAPEAEQRDAPTTSPYSGAEMSQREWTFMGMPVTPPKDPRVLGLGIWTGTSVAAVHQFISPVGDPLMDALHFLMTSAWTTPAAIMAITFVYGTPHSRQRPGPAERPAHKDGAVNTLHAGPPAAAGAPQLPTQEPQDRVQLEALRSELAHLGELITKLEQLSANPLPHVRGKAQDVLGVARTQRQRTKRHIEALEIEEVLKIERWLERNDLYHQDSERLTTEATSKSSS